MFKKNDNAFPCDILKTTVMSNHHTCSIDYKEDAIMQQYNGIHLFDVQRIFFTK